jgi:hypothetical protein
LTQGHAPLPALLTLYATFSLYSIASMLQRFTRDQHRDRLFTHTVKKVIDFPVPSRDVTYQSVPLAGIIKLFPATESLVSDILAGDGKIANLFLQVRHPALQRHSTENSKQIFPEKQLRGLSPNFHIHVSVSDLYIPTIGLPILLQENMWTDHAWNI